MQITEVIATRSTCVRRKVGALIVKDNRILASGYNGAPKGLTHCEEIGCRRQELNIPSGERHELCRAIHAEQNAIIQAATYGVSIKDAVIYVTTQPCVLCAKMIVNAGINRIIFQGNYPDDLALEILQEANIELLIYNSSEV